MVRRYIYRAHTAEGAVDLYGICRTGVGNWNHGPFGAMNPKYRVSWLRRGLGGAEPLLQRLQAGHEHAVTDGGDRLVLVGLVAVEPGGPLDVGLIDRVTGRAVSVDV